MFSCGHSARVLVSTFLAASVSAATATSAWAQTPPATVETTSSTQPASGEAGDLRSIADLEKLVAPIALYPDVVLAQALPASTVPLQVVEAARFAEKNPGKKEPPAGKNWELPVVNLLNFPDALKKLNEDLTWLQDLGDAMIDQQEDVFDAIQNVRKRVNDAGALPSNEMQTVVVEKEVVKIVPADPEIVYVPSYNPSVVYVDHHDDDDELLAGFIGFGVGMAVGACIWDDCDWHGGGCWHGGHGDVDIETGDINIDRGDRETNIGGGDRNVNRERNTDRSRTNAQANRTQWKPSTTAKTERTARKQADTRARSPSAGLQPANISRSQKQAQDRMRNSSTNTRNNTRTGSGGSNNRQGSAGASSSNRGGGAFGGSNSGSSARQQSSRGNSSRSSASRSSSGGSRSASGGSRSSGGSRGGGGAPRGGGGSRGGGGGRGGGGRR